MYPIEYEYVCEYNEEEEMERTKGRNERSERQQQNANQYSFTFNACKRRINMEKRQQKERRLRQRTPQLHSTDCKRCSDTDGKIATQCARPCTCCCQVVVSIRRDVFPFSIVYNFFGQ